MIVDTHCHIYGSEMENADEIIQQALENDIHVILNGTDPSSNREVLDLSAKYDNVHAALGYFYTIADEVTDEDIAILDGQLDDENVVAVGEIGLDYYYTKQNKNQQMVLFDKMLCLAEKHDLPVIVHCRKAMQDTLDMLKNHNAVGSMHAYQGSAEMAWDFTKLGFYMGIGGSVTYTNNKRIRKVLEKVDITHLLLETDSPYMAPEVKRGEKNTPQNLGYVIEKLADELDMSEDEVIGITTDNARKLFGI